MERHLLILDLDETLVYAAEAPLGRPPDFAVGPYAVYRRPHLDPFLARAFEWFEVAVWSVGTAPYVEGVVERTEDRRRGARPRVVPGKREFHDVRQSVAVGVQFRRPEPRRHAARRRRESFLSVVHRAVGAVTAAPRPAAA